MHAIEEYNNNQQNVITLNIQTFQYLVLAAHTSILLLGLLFEYMPRHKRARYRCDINSSNEFMYSIAATTIMIIHSGKLSWLFPILR